MRPIPTALTYVVYPRDGNNPAQVAAIAAELQKFVKDPSDIVASDTKTFGLNFWYIPLARWMVKEVRKVPGVRYVLLLDNGMRALC